MADFWARQSITYVNSMKRSFGVLVGIAQGLLCDSQLSDDEIRFLKNWLDANDEIAHEWPGDIVYDRVREALADGVVDEAERAHLVETLQMLVGTPLDEVATASHVTGLAFDQVAVVGFPGARFCLTGDFVYGPRESCTAAIVKRGGEVATAVTKKLQYLVVGSLGSREWKNDSYGTKIDKAMKYKRDGCPILIVKEESWTSSLNTVS